MQQLYLEFIITGLLGLIFGYFIWKIVKLEKALEERIKNEQIITSAMKGTKGVLEEIVKAHNELVTRVGKLETVQAPAETEPIVENDFDKVMNYSPSPQERLKRKREAE